MTGDLLNIMAGMITAQPLTKSWGGGSARQLRPIEDVHAEISELLDAIDQELGDQDSSAPENSRAALIAMGWSP